MGATSSASWPDDVAQAMKTSVATVSVSGVLDGTLHAIADLSVCITQGRSLTSRLIRDYLAAGVQHIAFASPDTFAAAEQARAGALNFLEIGPSYRDDVEARFGAA